MSDLIFTRCPHCNTLFRLAAQQLSAAKGAVRCGQCYQVFLAMQHVVDPTALQAAGQPIPMRQPVAEDKPFELEQPAPAIASTSAPSFSSIDFSAAITPESTASTPRLSENIFASDSAFDIDEDPLFKPEAKKKPKRQDDAWAEALLKELDGEASQFSEPDFSSQKTSMDFIQNEGDDYFGAAKEAKSAASEGSIENDLSETFKGLSGRNLGSKTIGIELPDLDEKDEFTDADESWAQAMLKELESEQKKPSETLSLIPSDKEKNREKEREQFNRQKKTAVEKPLAKEVKDELDEFDFDALFHEETAFSAEIIDPIVAAPVQKDNLFDFTPSEPEPLIEKIGPASIEFTVSAQKQKTGLSRIAVWALGCTVALAMLFGQYLFFNFNRLSHDQAWRPWYEKACGVFHCTLPKMVDVSQIRSRNMTLSERNGSYVVDFLVKNHAPFAQPFPLLELRFSDINGKVIARRLFKPNEYVRGELTGAREMPAGVDIRFSIEVIKPSVDAVNFDLNFFATPEEST